MNINVPCIEVYVARWALTNEEEKEGSERGWLYGVKSSRHKALQFHVLLESGASYWGLPLNAIKTNKDNGWLELSNAQLCQIDLQSDTPNEHKCAHIIELDSGHLVAYPNNRVIFNDSSLTKGDAANKGYKINTKEYLIDESKDWSVAESDDFLYD